MNAEEIRVSELLIIKQVHGAGSQSIKSDQYSVWNDCRKVDLFPELDEHIHSSQRQQIGSYVHWAYSKILSFMLMILLLTLTNDCRHNDNKISI